MQNEMVKGFYWVLPVFDVDSDADSWVQEVQPAYWDGEKWHILGTEEWSVKWTGPRIDAPDAALLP